MAQRLVRKICDHCKEEYNPRPEMWQEARTVMAPIAKRLPAKIQGILNQEVPTLVRGKGCKYCSETGYSGRQLIIEVLVPDANIESLIAQKAAISEFRKASAAQGMITMEQDGLLKSLEGTTTFEEVWRVTRG